MSKPFFFKWSGEPLPQARPRLGNGVVYTPARTATYRAELVFALLDNGAALPNFRGDVSLRVIFRRSTKRRVDIDNLLKALKDAFTDAAVWEDDSQVVDCHVLLQKGCKEPGIWCVVEPYISAGDWTVEMMELLEMIG